MKNRLQQAFQARIVLEWQERVMKDQLKGSNSLKSSFSRWKIKCDVGAFLFIFNTSKKCVMFEMENFSPKSFDNPPKKQSKQTKKIIATEVTWTMLTKCNRPSVDFVQREMASLFSGRWELSKRTRPSIIQGRWRRWVTYCDWSGKGKIECLTLTPLQFWVGWVNLVGRLLMTRRKDQVANERALGNRPSFTELKSEKERPTPDG